MQSQVFHNKTVAVALSGGIDSAIAAYRLQQQGAKVLGLFLKHPYQQEDETDAQKMADFLGIPLKIHDVSEHFEAVVENFTQEYFAGRTPNPCVLCNQTIKFGVLLNFALDKLACEFYATGHYVRRGVVDGFPALFRGVDDSKDQAYVLYGIDRSKLDKLIFPLGEMTKAEVRRMADEIGLPLRNKKESQDICFVKSGCHSEFLHARRPGVDTSGRFVDTDGKVLALHGGFEQFTVGQRKGMGIGFGQRVFVLQLNADTHDVVIGPWEKLARKRLIVKETRWLLDLSRLAVFQEYSPVASCEQALHPVGLKGDVSGKSNAYSIPKNPTESLRCDVKIRYRSKAYSATVIPEGNNAVVELDEAVYGVAPGQSAVFYQRGVEGDRLLGGGVIVE